MDRNKEKKPITFRLEDQYYTKLIALSNAMRRTSASFIREGVELVLDKYKDEIKDEAN